MIELAGVDVELGGVRGVDLCVEPGTWTGLVGPNGAGKTTLLRAIAGLVPYGGSIRIDRRELSTLRPGERARALAIVPQSPLLPPEMTVAEYVALGRTPRLGMLGRAGESDRLAVEHALARLDLAVLAGRQLGALSGGERQRAVIARALAQDAPALLLDEPTTALDIGRQQEVLDLVAALRAERGLTVLSAMHELTLAGRYPDRVALMAGGRVVAEGPPGDVLREELIARHYRARVRVIELDGAPAVLPGGVV